MQPFIEIIKQGKQRHHEALIRHASIIIQKEKRRLNLKTKTEKAKKIVKGKTEDRIAQEKECMQMIRIDYYR